MPFSNSSAWARRLAGVSGCAAFLLLTACGGAGSGGSDSDGSSSSVSTETEDNADSSTGDTLAESQDESGDAAGAPVDCAAVQDSIEVLGQSWQLMMVVQPGQDPSIFDSITDPSGVLIVDFGALDAAVEELRVFEPYGDLTAGFLNNTLEVAGVIEQGAAGDDAARLAAMDEVELITGGMANVLDSQITFGEAVAAAGC